MALEAPRQIAKREQIRSAAAELFLKHGFAGTSMDAVTAAAGVSKETLYRYYETKAALFADVLKGLIASSPSERMDSLPSVAMRSSADLERQLISATERYLSTVLEPAQLALVRVVIAEGSNFPELVEAFRTTLPATGGAVLIKVLEAGREAGVLASTVDLQVAARAFAGLLMMFIFRDGLLLPAPRRPDRRQVADMVRIFVHGIGATSTRHV